VKITKCEAINYMFLHTPVTSFSLCTDILLCTSFSDRVLLGRANESV